MKSHFCLIQGANVIVGIFIMFIVFLGLLFLPNKTLAATPPLLPFDNTGNLYVLDDGSDNILCITSDGVVTIEVTAAEIMAVTGETSVSFINRGIAFDAAGAMYFTESSSDCILKRALDGTLSVLTSEADIMAVTGETSADPEGIAFGSDGFLYVNDEYSDSVLRVNPTTGAVSVYVNKATLRALVGNMEVDMECAIVGAEGGIVYAASDRSDTIFKITSGGTPSILAGGTPPFSDLDVFMTRAPNGDLIIADNSGSDTIHRVTPAGVVSTFLSKAYLEACIGQNVDLEGGIAFDDSGNFYVAENDTNTIYKFDTALQCSIFVDAAAIQAVTGIDPYLGGGIAFAPRPAPPPAAVPTISQWGMIILSLLLAVTAIFVLRRRSYMVSK